ncbi:hypothetical protein ACFY36_37990 [Actinoplanes sp. NPDC000266]
MAKPLNARNCLLDTILHSQDTAVPLDQEFPVKAEQSRASLQRVREMS